MATSQLLAATGIAGPALFAVLVIVQGLRHPDYSHVAMPISALAALDGGWVQNANFIVVGVLMSAFAVGLHPRIHQGPGGMIGPALLILSGVGLGVAGAFPLRIADGVLTVPVGHLVGASLAFLGAGSGLIVLSLRISRDQRWRSLGTYTLVTGVAIIVLFVAQMALGRAPGAPLYSWAGAIQRATVAVWFACTIALALRSLRVASAGDAFSATHTAPQVGATTRSVNGDRANVGVFPPLIGLLVIVCGLGLHTAYPAQLLPPGWLPLATGLALLGLGVALQAVSIRTLRRSRTDVVFRRPTSRVVTAGPYGRSRNPIYVSVLLQYLGLALATNSAWLLALMPVLLLYLRIWVIAREERYLERTFGDEYRAYRASVPRWL